MDRRRVITSALVGIMLLGAAFPAAARVEELYPDQPAPVYWTDEMVDETPHAWFVEFSGAPLAEGGSASAVKSERAQFRAEAARQNVKFQERFEYEELFNGISIAADASQVAALSRLPGVKAIYPVVEIARPEVEVPTDDIDLVTALAMTGADIVQSELGYTGKGIKVAVMDTGIDYHHPDLGGGFGKGYKVAYGYDFVGDDFNADPTHPGYNPVPVPDPDPDDCAIAGHGTHVAGIVGANGRIKGVAPDVTLGAYRVFGCEGSTTADVMLAAMERAYKDKMDILNMSIGSAFQWPGYPTAVAADRLVKKGMVVVASIGNSGEYGLYSTSAPGNGSQVIGVASFDNSHATLRIFRVDGAGVGFTPATASPLPPTAGTLPIASADVGVGDDLACVPLPAGSLEGAAALVQRGGCTFYEKALHAQNAGAAAVILYNNVAGRVNPTVAGEEPITIPVVAITNEDGLMIRDLLESGDELLLEWTDETGSFESPTGGLISSFSSYGLAPDLSLKPDLGAPGGGIYSTYPLEAGGYATIGGTSMSAPHVAGAAALLLEAMPKAKPDEVQARLMNTADPKYWWGAPALGFLDSVNRQGAGMLQIDKAILADVVVETPKLALGESTGKAVSETLTIRNNSGRRITYALSHVEAVSTGGDTYSPSFFIGDDVVSFQKDTVTLSPRGVTKVKVSIAPDPSLPDGTIYGGYIVLTPVNNDGPVLRVPYAGYKGDYQEKEVLTPTPYGFPWLARAADGSYYKEGEGAVFTMADGDIPYVLFHLDHQSSHLRIGVRPADGGAVTYFLDQEYMSRNSQPTGFFAIGFDGIVMQGKKERILPDGDYVLLIEVLKPLGNAKNKDHWETWTSPVFTIDRSAE
ncbi:subtilisin family serine protease [Symbiobacterium terraclitae]|uniref:Subtilisin family serine protease n=1 Tax=Symbiobacterium terraclitae TaxID=557451 RepID=A0ABS4JVT4_9FIRM|nr:S8 family serine peptidase [Symbiobacterium terraclitae]MBP2019631.1 subtilisin family serine protease [Symbiobacterium terraclitae]